MDSVLRTSDSVYLLSISFVCTSLFQQRRGGEAQDFFDILGNVFFKHDPFLHYSATVALDIGELAGCVHMGNFSLVFWLDEVSRLLLGLRATDA